MEFVAVLFTSMFSFVILSAVHSDTYCRNGIVDIYYPADKVGVAYHSDCKFTKTIRNCSDCSLLFVPRGSQYDRWAARYTNLGLQPPYPKRSDTAFLHEPIRYY